MKKELKIKLDREWVERKEASRLHNIALACPPLVRISKQMILQQIRQMRRITRNGK